MSFKEQGENGVLVWRSKLEDVTVTYAGSSGL